MQFQVPQRDLPEARSADVVTVSGPRAFVGLAWAAIFGVLTWMDWRAMASFVVVIVAILFIILTAMVLSCDDA